MNPDPPLEGSQPPLRRLKGTLTLFGFPSREARLDVLERSGAWRGTRAILFGGGGVLLAVTVSIIPPHAPRVVAALGSGGFFALRKWRERFTVLALLASCPKCGGGMALRPGTPLRPVLSVPCEGCHHDSRLTVETPGTSQVDKEKGGFG